MSKELPFMRFWIADYMRDTRGLTYEQHGVYFLLLCFMWEEGGWLPDNDHELATRFGMPRRKWLGFRADLSKYLTSYGPPNDKRLTQKRLQEEWNKAIEHRDKQAAKGRKGGLANGETQKLKRQMSNVKQNPGLSTGSSPGLSTRVSREEPVIKERIIPTTSQEDRGDGLEVPACLDRRKSLSHLLQTPAMRSALAKEGGA